MKVKNANDIPYGYKKVIIGLFCANQMMIGDYKNQQSKNTRCKENINGKILCGSNSKVN